ncbi:MAG TPA: glycerate kinase, partial [Erysipelotrichaceae bacterium]|nr:glycerate kinase [Erysipelotrichaceae bacterium]
MLNKVICIPDSFKGTLSSSQIIAITKSVFKKHNPNIDVLGIEVADGGEGTVDAFLSISGGEKITHEVCGPRFEKINSFYGILPDHIAVIEMASCAGLPLVKDNLNPLTTTTFGVGELMISAWEKGCRKMIIGLGGSSTNDGGCGASAALGVRFLDESGQEFIPTGGTLSKIHTIDVSKIHPLINETQIITMCDIDNPMFGENGAAYVFGPQKGADIDMVKILDQGLRNLSICIENDLGKSVSEIPGSGAAGGMGGGMVAFFNSTLQSGIETILDIAKFDELIKGCDLVITGEGRIDSQTLRGKVPIGVAKRAKKLDIPVLCVVGSIGEGIDDIYNHGVTSIISINNQPIDFSISKSKSVENLTITM